MIRVATLSLALFTPVIASACGGSSQASAKAVDAAEAATAVDATACAEKAKLIGSSCSYSTSMMAQRVLAEGDAWTFAGAMAASEEALESHVAAPFTMGPEKIHVIANQVVEQAVEHGAAKARGQFQGRVLEVDGVKYFLLLSYEILNA